MLVALVTIWLTGVGGILFALQAFNAGSNETRSIANGAVYMTVLVLTIVINLMIIVPGVLMLQPLRLWNVLKTERQAVTPRQRFRGRILYFCQDKTGSDISIAVYPRTYDPLFAMSASVLGITFASTFSIVFPILGPAVLLLLFLSMIGRHQMLLSSANSNTEMTL